MLTNWIDDLAILIVRRTMAGAGDRSDIIMVKKLIIDKCPFNPDTVYSSLGVQPDGSATVILPAIPGHQHVIGVDGKPSCGCTFTAPVKATPVTAKK